MWLDLICCMLMIVCISVVLFELLGLSRLIIWLWGIVRLSLLRICWLLCVMCSFFFFCRMM